MTYNPHSSKFMPTTPKLIKYLAIFTLAFGCLSSFFHSLLGAKLGISFISLFALSAKGLFSGFIWQPITFLFLPQIQGSLSFYFLFSLAFDAYLLWYIGCKVYHLFGKKLTLKILFIPSIIGALIPVLLSPFFGLGAPLFGLTFAMIPLIMAYTFSSPETNFQFMAMQALQTKWLGIALIFIYLFQDLSSLNFTALLAHTLVVLVSYFYLTYFHKLRSPFSFTDKLFRFFSSKHDQDSSAKVIYLYEEQVRKESKMDKVFNKMKRNQKLNIWDKIKLRSYRGKD
jgi:hypothetical protein